VTTVILKKASNSEDIYVTCKSDTFRMLFNDVLRAKERHNEEHCNFYPSPSVIRMIKSRKLRLTGHVARMGEKNKA
jgi:hypothetical protein